MLFLIPFSKIRRRLKRVDITLHLTSFDEQRLPQPALQIPYLTIDLLHDPSGLLNTVGVFAAFSGSHQDR